MPWQNAKCRTLALLMDFHHCLWRSHVEWGGGIIASKQYKLLLRATALINYAVFWCNVNVRMDEMLAEAAEALTERRSMGYLLGCVQREPAVMCSESRKKKKPKNKQTTTTTTGVHECRMNWCQLTCSPTGPGSPGNPLGPSSPFWPNMPCCPLGPASPSLPCGRWKVMKSKYLHSQPRLWYL